MFKGLVAILGLMGGLNSAAWALSEPFPSSPAGTLFASDQILKIELDAPLKELFEKWSELPYDSGGATSRGLSVKGRLTYFTTANTKITLPVKAKVKGYSTAMECQFKKVELKFKDEDTRGTLFEGMRTVDLNTHCDASFAEDSMARNAHREALLYRLAKVLRIPTYQARPVLAQYRNTGFKAEDQDGAIFQAFFVEDRGDLVRRTGWKEVKDYDAPDTADKIAKGDSLYKLHAIYEHSEIDVEDFLRITYFNKMIINYDFSIPSDDFRSLWNVKVFEVSPGHWVPMPYDFSIAYAPSSKEPLRMEYLTVRHTPEMAERVKKSFLMKQQEVFQLIEELGGDEDAKQGLRKAFTEFYQGL